VVEKRQQERVGEGEPVQGLWALECCVLGGACCVCLLRLLVACLLGLCVGYWLLLGV
jgi:hypothetical protein